MGSGLNAWAAEFRPSTAPVAIPSLPDDPFDLNNPVEMAVSPDELAELESAEDWVKMMAECEEQEHEHLIALSLRYADKQTLQDVSSRVANLKFGRGAFVPAAAAGQERYLGQWVKQA